MSKSQIQASESAAAVAVYNLVNYTYLAYLFVLITGTYSG